MLFKTDIINDS